MTDAWWEQYERGRIAWSVYPMGAGMSKAERAFKLAFLTLVLDGLYPSGRQIYKLIGKDVDRKVNLNGRECAWLHEMRKLFGIEPYVGYTKRAYRTDWEDWLQGGHSGPKYPFRLRRGPKGTLVVCEEWIENRRAEQKALDRQLDTDRYEGAS